MAKDIEKIYKRSGLVLLCKEILNIAKAILPKRQYDFFYRISLKSYKAFIRFLYLRHLVYFRIINDKQNLEKFQLIYQAMPYSLVGSSGLSQAYDAVLDVIKNNISGDIVECGVAEGGCSLLMARTVFKNSNNQNRNIWLFDSFEGLPDPTEKDFSNETNAAGDFIRPLEKGSCLGTLEKVENLFFSKFKMDRNRIKMVKGWFENTLPGYKSKISKISILRIDADWYESTKCCLDNLYDNVEKGGFIIIDDYGTCFGAKKALDEFLGNRKLPVELIHDGRGGCYFKKPK